MSRDQNRSSEERIKKLLKQDSFSKWMGIEIISVSEGYCKIGCRIRDEMTNGFGVTHGGIIFSLADTALAFSASSFGEVALALDNSISFTQKSYSGDRLTATSTAVNITRKTGLFDIRIKNQKDITIAMMKGSVYRTGKSIGQE